MDRFRPGRADSHLYPKYGIRDYRGGGRSSAAETAMRVAAGAIAKISLEKCGMHIRGYLAQLGPIKAVGTSWIGIGSRKSVFLSRLRQGGRDGGIYGCAAQKGNLWSAYQRGRQQCSARFGEPIFDRLDADIAHAMMSIEMRQTGVEIGAGFDSVIQKGTVHR